MSEGNRGMQVGEDGLGNKAPGAREEGTPIHFSCPISVVLSQWEARLSNSHSSFEHSKGKVLCLPLFCHFSLGYFKLILVLTDPGNRSFFGKQTHDIRILEKDDNGILKSLSQPELKLFYLPASEITNPVPYHSISVLKSLF